MGPVMSAILNAIYVQFIEAALPGIASVAPTSANK
jgi:hypothetical protein